MNDIINPVWYLNGTVVMWVAVSLAAIFLLAIVIDVVLRKRKKRKAKSGSIRARLEANQSPGFFRSLRLTLHSLKGEAARRRRHAERARERDEALRKLR